MMTASHRGEPRRGPKGRLRISGFVAIATGFLLTALLGFGCGDDDGGPTPDTTPPAAVTDLSVTAVTDSSATLEWTAPGDNGTTGTASGYDIRYGTETITDQDWGAADSVDTPPVPQSAGSDEAFTVDGLSSGTPYYFALKTVDDASNWSDLSNVADTTTAGGPLEEPVLALSPDTLGFGSDQTGAVVTITNTGTGTLHWRVDAGEAWLSASPDSGSTTTEVDEVTVTVTREGLAPGSYSGTVTVTPNVGEDQDVDISMSVSGPGPEPGEMVLVPAGTFSMGDGVAYCGTNQHQVTLTRDFYLGQHEVTNQEYLEAVQWAYDHDYVTATPSSVRDNLDGSTVELLDLDDTDCELAFSGGAFSLRNASHGINSDHPVKEVTWYGAARYCDWLSLLAGAPMDERAYAHDWSCNGGDPYGSAWYRLPTDAEWEYAGQWDDERIYPWGDEDPDCSRANSYGCVGWTSPVGSYPDAPTALGLSDMTGNVWEWCDDWWVCDLGTAPVTDPTGPSSGSYRVLRGGSWSPHDYYLRCAYRFLNHPEVNSGYFGFRVARTE